MYDISHHNLPRDVTDYCLKVGHCYDTRLKQHLNYKPTKIKSEIGKQSMSYAGSILWRGFPNDLGPYA